MAGGAASGGSSRSDTYKEARTWLLMPAWLVLVIFVLAPVLMMLVYSFPLDLFFRKPPADTIE